MNKRSNSPKSLATLAFDEDGATNQTFSLQSIVPSKDLTYHALEYTAHSPFAAGRNDERYFSGTPKIGYGQLNDVSDLPSFPTITIIPNETKMDTLNTIQPTEPAEDRHLIRHRRAEAKSWDLSGMQADQQKSQDRESTDRQDMQTTNFNSKNTLSAVTFKNGPSRLGSSLKRLMEGSKSHREINIKTPVREDGDQQEKSAGVSAGASASAGRRWKKVTLMMHTLTKLKTNPKSEKSAELNGKQLELLSEFGNNPDQLKSQSTMKKIVNKPSLPRIIHHSESNISPTTATVYKGSCIKNFCVLISRILTCFRPSSQRVLSELAVRRKKKNKEENKKLTLWQQIKTPINPSVRWRLGWDVLLMLLVVIDMIILPLQISFSILASAEAYQYTTDAIFMIDILLAFNTAYYQNGDLITDHKSIAKHYVKSWFWIDLIATLPLEALEDAQGDQSTSLTLHRPAFLKLFKILRLIKVIRALRIFKLSKIFWRFKLFFGYSQAHSFFQLLKLAIVVLLVSHWIACLWHLVAVFELEYTDNDTWLTEKNLLNADPSVRYIYSLYWSVTTMLTVGYGDITPVSVCEIWVTVFAMFFACGVFAYSINTIGSIIHDLDQTKSKVSWKIYAINQFMQKNNMGKAIQERVRGYMEHLLEEENNRKHDQEEFLELMPDHLRKDILMDLNGKLLTENIIFNINFTSTFLQNLATKLQERSLGPGENIYSENEKNQDNCFYIVTKGRVQLFFQRTKQTLKTLTKGEYFGEVAFFSGKNRTISARSANYSQVFYLEKKDFLEALENSEIEKESYCEIRDKVDLYDDYSPLKVRCFACDKENHYAQTCPQLQYIPDPKDVISLVTKENKKFRSSFVRKDRKRFNALNDLQKISEGTEKFRDEVIITPGPRLVSRTSSFTYTGTGKHRKTPEDFSAEFGSPSAPSETHEEKLINEWKPDLPILEEEDDIIENSSQPLSWSQKSRVIKFKENSQAPEVGKVEPGKSNLKKKKKSDQEFEKIKIFHKYFVYNNADYVASRINRLNQLKIAPSKDRRHSSIDSQDLSSLLQKNTSKGRHMSINNLSIFPGLFRKEKEKDKLSQESLKTS